MKAVVVGGLSYCCGAVFLALGGAARGTSDISDARKVWKASGGFIVPPLATLAFELCVVADTGLKTGWV